jgi:hypothetical protein
MRKPSLRILTTLILAALAVGAPNAMAARHVRRSIPLQGLFSYAIFQGAGCSSPVKLCVNGTFAGPLAGRLDEVITSLTPTTQPGILLGVGNIVIHTRRGDLRCTESFTFNGAPRTDGEAGILCEFTGGTGHWVGASGYFMAYGAAVGGRPVGLGHYGGRLILP